MHEETEIVSEGSPGEEVGSRGPDILNLYFDEVGGYVPLTSEEEAELSVRIRENDGAARNRLVTANLRFVIKVAQGYAKVGIPLEDLISAGNLGLIKAAERFDGTRGIRFISYAVWWIRQAIHQMIAQDPRVVRLPRNRIELLQSVTQTMRRLQQEGKDDPHVDDVAAELGISPRTVEDILLDGRSARSLNEPGPEWVDGCLFEQIEDVRQQGPDDEVMASSVRKQVSDLLGGLEPREAEVLRLSFGLEGQDPMTLADIGKQLGISRERVRQIKDRALARLRCPKNLPELRLLVDAA